MTMALSPSDTLEVALEKLAEGNTTAAAALADLVAECRAIDDTCDHPFRYLIQLDRYKVRGMYLAALYRDVCNEDLVKMLGLLRWAELGRLRPTDIRAAITRATGGITPPWFRGLDPTLVLSLLRAHQPTFGGPR
jgi:hypothetical protein